MVIGDSKGVEIARRLDNRHSLGELFLGFVVAFEDDERSRALRPADSRFVHSAQFLLDFQRLRSIIERLFRHPHMLVHLGRHAVDDRFAGHIIRIFDIINSPQDIFLRLVRLPHGHIDTREGVIGRSYNIGVPALEIQFITAFGIKRRFVEVTEAHINDTEEGSAVRLHGLVADGFAERQRAQPVLLGEFEILGVIVIFRRPVPDHGRERVMGSLSPETDRFVQKTFFFQAREETPGIGGVDLSVKSSQCGFCLRRLRDRAKQTNCNNGKEVFHVIPIS